MVLRPGPSWSKRSHTLSPVVIQRTGTLVRQFRSFFLKQALGVSGVLLSRMNSYAARSGSSIPPVSKALCFLLQEGARRVLRLSIWLESSEPVCSKAVKPGFTTGRKVHCAHLCAAHLLGQPPLSRDVRGCQRLHKKQESTRPIEVLHTKWPGTTVPGPVDSPLPGKAIEFACP